MKELPNFSQWIKLPEFLNKKEKVILLAQIGIFLFSFLFLILTFYYNNTEETPGYGGKYREGIVGNAIYINPISASRDTERDLVELLFSGLMKYDKDGNIIPDLMISNPNIEDGGRTYEVFLRSDIYFHDGEPITSDDIMFTIKTIQDPEYKSPLRADWLGVSVEKISDLGVRFKLKNPYPDFTERLTIKIMPEHIWRGISSTEFFTSFYHTKEAIGSGPYKIKKNSKKDYSKSIDLEIFDKYHLDKPYIKDINITLFNSEKELIKAAKSGKIDGFMLKVSNLKSLRGYNEHNLLLPRYFALFFNLSNKKFDNLKFRQALNLATDKNDIILRVFNDHANIVDSPVIPDFYGFDTTTTTYPYNIEAAKKILTDIGYEYDENGRLLEPEGTDFSFSANLAKGSVGNEVKMLQKCLAQYKDIYPDAKITGIFGELTKTAVIKFQEKYRNEILTPNDLTEGNGKVKGSTRAKLNEICFADNSNNRAVEITIHTTQTSYADTDYLFETAKIIKEQWNLIGITVNIEAIETSSTQKDLEIEIIRPRNYETLIFGSVLKMMPDSFPFWHSSQVQDPGLNLSMYKNKSADKLLEQIREETEESFRKEKYNKLQEIIIQDAPCIFLFNPNNSYFVSKKIKGIQETKGIDLSKRFSSITSWYINTTRKWK